MRGTVLFLLSGLTLACGQAVPSLADPVTTVRQPVREPYADPIAEAVQRFGVPETWIRAVLRAESNGDPRAISTKGAMGLMQIMPSTWAALRTRYRLGSDPYDPHDNIIAGAGYIRELFDRYGSPGWIAAYNAGPGRYEASLTGRPLPTETRAYVANVAPVLGVASVAGPTLVAAVDPFAWTRAPLFIASSDRKPTAGSASADRSPTDAPADSSAAVSARDVSAIAPHTSGLFVARADTGHTP